MLANMKQDIAGMQKIHLRLFKMRLHFFTNKVMFIFQLLKKSLVHTF